VEKLKIVMMKFEHQQKFLLLKDFQISWKPKKQHAISDLCRV